MASKRHIRRRRCAKGKIGHLSKEEAYAHAAHYWKRFRETVEVYRCQSCRRWHIGH